MTVRQFEVWKCQPAGFERLQTAASTRLANPLSPTLSSIRWRRRRRTVRISACTRSERMNWFSNATGSVSWERQQQIKAKLKEVWLF